MSNPFYIDQRVIGTFYGVPFVGTVIDIRSDHIAHVLRDGKNHAEWFHVASLTPAVNRSN